MALGVPFDGDMLLLALASTHTRLSLCRKMGPWFAIGWRVVADARKGCSRCPMVVCPHAYQVGRGAPHQKVVRA